MKAVDIPDKFPIVWGADAGGSYIRPIPEASQIGIEGGAASLTDGFPPLNFTPRSAGGVPPFGEDMNGILQQITAWSQWQNAGATVAFDAGFAADIDGYPAGAVLKSTQENGLLWYNLEDDNSTDPDGATPSNWVRLNRACLSADTTFYVSTTGSDITGLGTSIAPWQTLQHAAQMLETSYDLNGFIVTVQLADGTYAQANFSGPLAGAVGNTGALIINGNSGTPSNVVINNGGGTFSGAAILSSNGAAITVQNLKVTATGPGLYASKGGVMRVGSGVEFGTCAIHMQADSSGFLGTGGSAYKIDNGAPIHLYATTGGTVNISGSVVTTTSNTFSTAFAVATILGNINADGATFPAAACAGTRYSATLNSVIVTGGGGANFFPGNSAGSTATGGQYA